MQLTNAFKTGDSRGKSYFSEVSQYIGDNPLQLGRDAYGIADTDIVPLLKQLQKKGVEVHIIGVKHDQIFPIDKMRDRVKSLYPIYSIEGAHNSIYINTEPFIEYINKILKN